VAVATKDTGKVVQTWIGPALAEQLKQQAEQKRRSVSALVRIAIEDRLRGAA
jgi:Ribbon-helix-helix protein, copG family